MSNSTFSYIAIKTKKFCQKKLIDIILYENIKFDNMSTIRDTLGIDIPSANLKLTIKNYPFDYGE